LGQLDCKWEYGGVNILIFRHAFFNYHFISHEAPISEIVRTILSKPVFALPCKVKARPWDRASATASRACCHRLGARPKYTP
jgi:hypothetical protein